MIFFFPWVLVSILYFPIMFSLFRSRWLEFDYAHAYFILPVSLWMAFNQRHNIIKALNDFKTARPNKWGTISLTNLAVMGLGLFLYALGWRWDYLFITTFSLIPVLYGMIGYLYGPRVQGVLFFSISYLIFLVPPPLELIDTVTLPMRYGVSAFSEVILKFFHYPVSREGLLLSIENHELFLGPPCSGFRSLMTMLALGVVYIYFSPAGFRKKWFLFAAIVPLALLGNLIRVLGLCLTGFYFGPHAAEGIFHNVSGVLIFVFMILGLMGIEKWFVKRGYSSGN